MTNPFLQQLGTLRRVKTRRGDTIQRIAARELGDATLWHTIVYINELRWPFIQDDPNPPAGVIQAGDAILVPTATSAAVPDANVDQDKIFGVDADLTKGELSAEDGDITLVHGTKNYAQALRHRLDTRIGELTFHHLYGNGVYTIVGKGGTRPNAVLANAFVQRAVASDPRTADASRISSQLTGDVLYVNGEAIATDGTNQPVQF